VFKTGNSIYFCTLPDCTNKIKQPLALGKRSICWRCGNPFIMNEYAIRLANPHCEDCHKSKDGKLVVPNNAHLGQDENQNPTVIKNEPILAPLSERLRKATSIHNHVAIPDDEEL